MLFSTTFSTQNVICEVTSSCGCYVCMLCVYVMYMCVLCTQTYVCVCVCVCVGGVLQAVKAVIYDQPKDQLKCYMLWPIT
jgi:predicted membrane channel-forming protein YqfA (hemolysin III family)